MWTAMVARIWRRSRVRATTCGCTTTVATDRPRCSPVTTPEASPSDSSPDACLLPCGTPGPARQKRRLPEVAGGAHERDDVHVLGRPCRAGHETVDSGEEASPWTSRWA